MKDVLFGRSISRFTVIAMTSLVLLALPAAASADQGGMTISSAPELPLGRSVASTVSASATLGKVCATQGRSGEFWRVSMNAFDHLVVDFGSTNGDVVGINMLSPTVTDATVAEAETTGGCLDLMTTSTKTELQFQASGGGRYTMLVADRQGSNDLSYEMVARVLHYTQVTITAPARVRAHTRVTYGGRVTGASSGAVTLRLRASTDHQWKTLAHANLSAAGTFSFKMRVAGPGLYRIRAFYPGDDSHLPSSATASFKVTR
jgi:hypothetical protein